MPEENPNVNPDMNTNVNPNVNPNISPGRWIGGLLIALAAGAILNVVAGMMAISAPAKPLGFLIGAVPGALFLVPGLLFARRHSFGGMAGGLCVGGCIIALIGGACGASMVGMSFH